ncbi:MAG: ATP-dependent Clp protease ATP-binding subunit, partial [Clostridiales bacterium]|nr:ATP-dependent Clp protease ATP-binding subunit [Clostridiales bacterium]
RRKPYSVILFDEIEKAHPDVLNILLQILDEGRVTDAQGRTVNFENTVIAMTSNAGSSDKSGIVGFNRSVDELAKEKAMKALGEFLRPEFLGRVDEIIVFHALTEENLKQITGLMLDELKEPLSDKGISFRYDDSALKAVTTLAEGGKFAARDLRKVIRREVEDKVANLLIEHFEHPPKVLSLSADSDNLKLDFSNEAE